MYLTLFAERTKDSLDFEFVFFQVQSNYQFHDFKSLSR